MPGDKEGENGRCLLMGIGFFLEWWKCPGISGDDLVLAAYYTHWIVHLKRVKIMVCELDLKKSELHKERGWNTIWWKLKQVNI